MHARGHRLGTLRDWHPWEGTARKARRAHGIKRAVHVAARACPLLKAAHVARASSDNDCLHGGERPSLCARVEAGPPRAVAATAVDAVQSRSGLHSSQVDSPPLARRALRSQLRNTRPATRSAWPAACATAAATARSSGLAVRPPTAQQCAAVRHLSPGARISTLALRCLCERWQGGPQRRGCSFVTRGSGPGADGQPSAASIASSGCWGSRARAAACPQRVTMLARLLRAAASDQHGQPVSAQQHRARTV